MYFESTPPSPIVSHPVSPARSTSSIPSLETVSDDSEPFDCDDSPPLIRIGFALRPYRSQPPSPEPGSDSISPLSRPVSRPVSPASFVSTVATRLAATNPNFAISTDSPPRPYNPAVESHHPTSTPPSVSPSSIPSLESVVDSPLEDIDPCTTSLFFAILSSPSISVTISVRNERVYVDRIKRETATQIHRSRSSRIFQEES